MQSIKRFIKPIGFPFLAVFAIGALVYYIAFAMVNQYSSDYADTLYWTQAMFDGGSLFNPNFEYAALLPFGGQWFYAPFYCIFGFSITTQICGQLLFLVVFVASLFWLTKCLKWSNPWCFTTVFVILGSLCISEKLREVYFAHIFYYGLASLFLILSICFLLSAFNNYADKKGLVFLILSGLFLLFINTNGVPSLSTCTLPLIAALLLVFLLETPSFRSSKSIFFYITFGFIIIMTVIGFFLGKILLRDVSAPYQEAYTAFQATGSWNEAFSSVFPEYFSLFTGILYEPEMFTSEVGLNALLRIPFALMLLILPVCALFSYPKLKTFGEKLLVVTHFLLTGFLLLAFLFGGLNNASWRLSPSVVTGLFVSLVFIRHLWQSKNMAKRFGGILAFCAIVFCLLFTIQTYLLPANNPYTNNSRSLAATLEEKGFTYGYANFWNAGAVTALTNNKVKIRNIEITDSDIITPNQYQSNVAWFRNQGKNQKYVLVLEENEFARVYDKYSYMISSYEQWESFYFCTLTGPLFS